MLGRLRMSTDQVRDEYINLGKKVFKKTKSFTKDGNFKASALEKAIKEVVRKYGMGGNSEELLLDERRDGICKT
jgi:phage-related protein